MSASAYCEVVYARLALDEYQAFTGTVEKWKVKENRYGCFD